MKTLVMRATREASKGRSWPLETTFKEHDKFLMAINVPGEGEIRQEFDGAKGWVKTRTACAR